MSSLTKKRYDIDQPSQGLGLAVRGGFIGFMKAVTDSVTITSIPTKAAADMSLVASISSVESKA